MKWNPRVSMTKNKNAKPVAIAMLDAQMPANLRHPPLLYPNC